MNVVLAISVALGGVLVLWFAAVHGPEPDDGACVNGMLEFVECRLYTTCVGDIATSQGEVDESEADEP